MALGIQDLNKKKLTKNLKNEKQTTRSVGSTPMPPRQGDSDRFPAGAWAKSHTARPWDANLSERNAGIKRLAQVPDATMNLDWLELCSHSLPGLGANPPSDLMSLLASIKLKDLRPHDITNLVSNFAGNEDIVGERFAGAFRKVSRICAQLRSR